MKEGTIPAKQRILDVASRLFYEQGYNSTGINQIINEADVAKGSLYHLFKSKEELCIEYLKNRHNYWFDKLSTYTSKGKTPRQKIIAGFDFLYDMNKKENFRGCSFLNIVSEVSAADKSILAVIQSHKQDLRDFFRSILTGYNQDTVDHIYLIFEGSIIESQVFREQWPVEKSKKIVLSLLK